MEMKKCILLTAILLSGLKLIAEQPLNVILVMTDDQGYPDIAYHGNPVIKTPNMDRLAESSVRFSDFHVNPFCSPTRSALMTGRMSDRVGVSRTNFQRNYLRLEEIVMPEYFKASGYRTGHFGKWHIGACYPYRPMDRGFDEWLGLGNNGLATTADLWDNDRMNDTYWHNGKLEKRPGFCSDVYFTEAISFIKKCRKENKPFFTYIATNVPDWDWNVKEEWMEPYKESCGRLKAGFFASISRVDWNLGRLLDFMEQEKLFENTILVFLTDNGSDVPEKNRAFTAGMRGFKGSLYEGGHRVPCFIRAPESLVGKPRDVDGLTAHVDLLPTFIDICGLKQPDRQQLPFDGRSLRSLISGSGDWDDRLLVFHHHNDLITPKKDHNAVVLTSEWRLIKNWNGKKKADDPAELYKIREDRGQKTDVAALYPDVVKELEAQYSAHWDGLGFEKPLELPILSSKAELRLSTDIARDGGQITQQAVRKGEIIMPLWAVKVGEAGHYRFEVCRWPREADAAMTTGLPPASDPDIAYIGHATWKLDVPGVALDVAEVELKLSGQKVLAKRVAEGDKSTIFELDLNPGPLDIEATMILSDGKRMGAYFVYAKKVE